MNPLVTLTTDFGTRDGYAGAMKGVIHAHCPGVQVVDLTHDVPPGDVAAGAFALAQAAPWFPPGTVHVAVVDPGVGSSRRALVVAGHGALFVGPDNGLLPPAAPGIARAIDRIPPDWPIGRTFHGRDLFARVAARLAAGAPVAELASEIVAPVRLGEARVERSGDGLSGVVIHVDRFGNLVTNLPADAAGEIEVAGVRAVREGSYADVAPGELVAYVGSAGLVEVGVRDGSAAERLGIGRGAVVRARAG